MSVLGTTPPDRFLAEYWQRRPLLIREAIADYAPPLTPDELAGLALDDDVESRLVETRDGQWHLRHGPFDSDDFDKLPSHDWTLLVQAVDLWIPEVSELLSRFDFLPRWRFDDVMVSFAVPGGSVGPHSDEYDVFLLQVAGERRWQVGEVRAPDAAPISGSDLRLLDDFVEKESWVLRPGDMLYLPPRVSHWGVALSQCLTFSIGFRAPTAGEMMADLSAELLAQDRDLRYTDPPMRTQMATKDIAPEFITQTQALLQSALADEAFMADWFARYMTAPKYPHLLEETGEQRRARYMDIEYLNGEPVPR